MRVGWQEPEEEVPAGLLDASLEPSVAETPEGDVAPLAGPTSRIDPRLCYSVPKESSRVDPNTGLVEEEFPETSYDRHRSQALAYEALLRPVLSWPVPPCSF